MRETIWKDTYREHEADCTLDEWLGKPSAFARFLFEQEAEARAFLLEVMKTNVSPQAAGEYLSLLDEIMNEMLGQIVDELREDDVDAVLANRVPTSSVRKRRRQDSLGDYGGHGEAVRLLDRVRNHFVGCLDRRLWQQRQSLPARFDIDRLFDDHGEFDFVPTTQAAPDIEDVLRALDIREQDLMGHKEKFFREAGKHNKEGGGLEQYVSSFSDQSLAAIYEQARTRLRDVSPLWRSYEDETINLFSSDLTDQPSYAADIYFTGLDIDADDESRVRHRFDREDLDYIMKKKSDGLDGIHLARKKNKQARVYVFAAEPSMRERIVSLAFDGYLPDAVNTLVHELRHQRQEAASPTFYDTIDRVALSEAQAEMNLLLEQYPATLRQAVDVLADPSGHYKVPKDMAICAAEFIASANAVGLNQEEISQMIVRAEWDYAAKRYANLDRALKRVREAMDIEESDVSLLWDMGRVQRKSEVLHIQIVFLEEMLKEMEKNDSAGRAGVSG